MKTKIKKPPVTTITEQEAAGAAAAYANCQYAIDKHQTALDKEMADAKAKIEKKYSATIKEGKELQTEAFEVLKAYAEQERGNWTAKSAVVGNVTLGFRSGKRAVQLPKGVTADKMVERLKEAGLKRFLRVVYELNKPALLEETKPSVLNQLKEQGIGFGNSENFYIEVG